LFISEECKDNIPGCPAHKDLCSEKECPKTCGFCGGPEECEDKDSECPKRLMEENCPRTCGLSEK
uniref:ShKT domain-containing protein n=1 Tax=Enterobius vermicularis TaxID=51028 RepID=A0A0N4UZ31_ENTVE